MKIGVLALQGAFAEHSAVLQRLGVEAVEIRLPGQLENLDGLILPGGESTSITKLMRHYALTKKLHEMAVNGFPLFGTCAGMIVLAKGISNGKIEPVGVMEIDVKRNAFGRQVDSFETDVAIPVLGRNKFHAVFIRAPLIASVGTDVEILAKLPNGTIIAARQGKLLVTAFHPELTDDPRFHQYFLDIIAGKK
ncbi:MAG: pyridoxal 5'-phosphate synthase glutaminase subunit PdxT [Dehalococcoidales bacterium]|nr:pyridoxal 5'-phosphate synthase glutaminase subunit PdxT [Dehalococcoidales bacterium]